ncbi:serine/threonine protein kinase [Streptomyces sp. NBC_01216]|uniref:serine/threonine protein kinase n=1 Tax=Streptomyces sp. NBC_01216 TaxID=2903778 RepID=UPI002E137248|nr:serine/threonine protein kinase [Streptomyces sp. NBC_01216]
MEDYAGRVLADRYRLPLPPSDVCELVQTRAFDTYSAQEVLVRQVPLPEVVDAEFLDDDGRVFTPPRDGAPATRRPADPAVRRAVEAAQAAAWIPDHPRLDQVFDVFAEAGSLWIVSELVAARPLAALLAERPLGPYRAAEIGSDVLTALRALHAHGWTHRNITTRTVLVCDDGRVVLTGLAAGAAEEALCGYAPVPAPDDAPVHDAPVHADEDYDAPVYADAGSGEPGHDAPPAGCGDARYGDPGHDVTGPGDRGRTGGRPAVLAETGRPSDPPAADPGAAAIPGATGSPGAVGPAPAADVRAARAGAIAAYRAGARAAARVGETGPLPVRRPTPGVPPVVTPTGPAAVEPVSDVPLPSPVPAQGTGPEPRWWSQGLDDEDEGDDADDPYPSRPASEGGPPHALLTGTWSDGPHAARDGAGPLSAGGGPVLPGSGRPALPAGYTAAALPPGDRSAAPSSPRTAPAVGDARDETGEEDRPAPEYRGPTTRLAGERARQARIAVVGAVTERWAPEQAGPVHENWRLAPPIGPATDLWALGALLYRAVQGHAPYPEDNAAELVQLVCAEPPAFAEECGALRPVVESLLRQDPTERPDFEELRGWLRSLVRSAPEPDTGTVPLPSEDAARLPIVRRRGELVRRRRGGAAGGRHRHRKGRESRRVRHEDERRPDMPTEESGRRDQSRYRARPDGGGHEEPRAYRQEEAFHEELPQYTPRDPRGPRTARGSRSLGRKSLLLVLLLLVGALVYALMFMPRQGADGGQPAGRASQEPGTGASPPPVTRSGTPASATPSAGTTTSRTTPAGTPKADLAAGYTLREDPEGFQVGVARGWRRSPINDAGQVRYTGGDFTLIVVPGRDTVEAHGSDPMVYQRTRERELQPWRDSSWSSASGLRRIDVGRQVMAVGQFTWQDSTGREVFVRNLALIEGGRYHVVQVIGPESERDKVSEIYDQAVKAYRSTR